MVFDLDGIDTIGLPKYINEANILREYLKSLNFDQLKNLWEANDKIVLENIERFKININGPLTPAVLAYDGILYKNMAPSVFTYDEWDYIDKHLFILSGLYGVLKPRDGIIPYRLEMQAKIDLSGVKSLYDYWNDLIYKVVSFDDDIIINLASKEYSDSIRKYVGGNVKMIDITFGSLVNNKVIVKATEAKANRRAMVRFMATNNVTDIEGIKKYNCLGYKFNSELSSDLNLVFIK